MKEIHILLVEDNEGDIVLTTEALEEWKIINKISICRDGKQAILFLEEIYSRGENELPDLILLDINLPKKNGREVLQYIKQNEYFKQIPVIMLTTSTSEEDILESYRHYANCFISKPVEIDDFFTTISSIENFWISIVKLPNN